jgi:hypothetical protein
MSNETEVIERDGLCVGFVKMTSLAASVAPSSIPASARRALVQCEGADVRWRADGGAPTSTDGMLLAAGAERAFNLSDITTLRFIQVTAGAVLQVSYFR